MRKFKITASDEGKNREYRQARMNAIDEIKKAILQKLSGCDTSTLNVMVDEWYGGPGFEVKVNNGDSPHDASKGLSWNWEIHIDKDGNIGKDSGSWSGLKAITTEQIDDLRNTVEILTQLNDLDWKTIFDMIDEKYPKYEEFFK